MDFLETLFVGNAVKHWLIAAAIAAANFLVLYAVLKVFVRRLEKFAQTTDTNVDDFISEVLSKTKMFTLTFTAIYIGSKFLTLPSSGERALDALLILILLVQAGIWVSTAVSSWLKQYTKRRLVEDAASATTLSALGFLSRLVIWTIVLLLALDNLGVNISALITGLGIGGIAVALALQNILGDLFASLSIVLDKPFIIGDFIIVNDHLGTVEHIGLKTTRLRSLSGEQLVFSNSDLLNSRIRNFKRMNERRILFGVGVTYQTPFDKLKTVPTILKQAVEAQGQTRFDRAHFKEFGDFSLNFEVVYFVLTPDYNQYMDIQQAINLELYKRFEQEGIEFAYPTQTLFVRNESGHDEEAKLRLRKHLKEN